MVGCDGIDVGGIVSRGVRVWVRIGSLGFYEAKAWRWGMRAWKSGFDSVATRRPVQSLTDSIRPGEARRQYAEYEHDNGITLSLHSGLLVKYPH